MSQDRTLPLMADGHASDMDKYTIPYSSPIREAVMKLESLDSQTLLVTDDSSSVIATVTDGDVRRGIIAGVGMNDPISKVMHTGFSFLTEGRIDVEKIREFRKDNIHFIPILNDERKLVSVLNLKKKHSMIPVDAVLMAGGKGERLRPLTLTTPKPLIKVGDKAIIDYNVDRLISYGVEHISVTVNYLKEQIEEHFKEVHQGVKVNCCREPEFLGTIGSIRYVREFYNDTILVMNSDLFTNIDFEDFYMHFKKNDADMSVAAFPYNVSVPYGILNLDGRNVLGVMEKPVYNYYAVAGIYLIRKSVLSHIPEGRMFHATDLVDLLAGIGKKVIRYPLNGTWIDIGNHQEYQKACELVNHID